MALIEQIERILEEKRGYIARRPEKAVFLFSGGLDSTISTGFCMEEWGTGIYPLFIDRGQSDLEDEEQAVDHFDGIYRNQFPDLYHEVLKIEADNPPQQLREDLSDERKDAKGYPMRDPIMQGYAVQYATTLGANTVLAGSMPNDPFPHNQLVAMRSQTLATCINMGDEWDWQITSPTLDPELGQQMRKEDLIEYAKENGLPHEETFSQKCGTDPDQTDPSGSDAV